MAKEIDLTLGYTYISNFTFILTKMKEIANLWKLNFYHKTFREENTFTQTYHI